MAARFASESPVPAAMGRVVGVAGVGLVGAGLWARREATRALERERIVGPPDVSPGGAPVAGAPGARAMAEFIRQNTVETTDGRTYAEIDAYLDPEGRPTADAASAARDERTGEPRENPDHAVWIQSLTLQNALTQAYVAFRLADLTVALGATFVAVGAGLAAAGRRDSRRRYRLMR